MARRVAVLFPDGETSLVEQFRQRWDPLAMRVAAHVTVAHPFHDDRDSTSLSRDMSAVIEDVAAFSLRLDTPTVTHDRYVFLLASRGGAEVQELHRRLYSGPLRDGPRPVAFVPHMTIGRCQDAASALVAVREAGASGLSFTGNASALSVYQVQPDGVRSHEFSVALRHQDQHSTTR